MTPPLSRLLAPLVAASTWIACGPAAPPRAPAPTEAARPPGPKPPALSRSERRALHARAAAAYDHKEFAGCATLFEQADDAYSAACCHALGGNRDAAFAQLAQAIDGKFSDLANLDRDTDLGLLHDDPRWSTTRARLVGKLAERNKLVNPELLKLHDDDQGDRAVSSFEQIDWTKVAPRDKARRQRVDEILAAGGAKVSADYYHAAMVYQHGDLPDEIQRAHDLAVKAVELDPTNDGARWLAAAAEDRKLMYEKKPQKWGTQFKKIDGVWVLWTVDPAITDAQRDEWNVPSLAESQARAAQLNAAIPAH